MADTAQFTHEPEPYVIAENRRIARDIYRMVLAGDTSRITRPGQFANIRLDGLYLRRPISVCSWRYGAMTLVYKVVGKGTAKMAALPVGAELDVLMGLGNGFDTAPARGKRVALIGGGVGLPPLLGLMEALRGGGAESVVCAMGFQSAEDVFFAEEFAALGAEVRVATVDGTRGTRGFVTDALKDAAFDYYFACGPIPMLKAVHALGREGQLSLEERMGCGFGACMGCACRKKDGAGETAIRLCMEGPVLTSGEVVF